MEEPVIPEIIDWDNLPWYNSDRIFTPQELSEVSIYQKQGSLIDAETARLRAHERRMLSLQEEFDRYDRRFRENIVNPFALSVWENGIEETRKRTIPPYAFDRFPDLPRELQLMIWEKAVVPHRGGKIRLLMSMTEEYSYLSEEKKGVHNPRQTTSVFRPRNTGTSAILDKGPVVLTKVCQDARVVYRNIYAKLACRYGGLENVDHHSYDTRDQFYMGEKDFTDFKILVDVLILQHTTRRLDRSLMKDVIALQGIRNLTVDLNIFGGAPADIWIHFPKLEALTIAFYPFATIRDGDESFMDQDDLESYQDNTGFDRNLVFVKPLRTKKFVRRAEAINALAMNSLRAVVKKNPTWKMPRIEVVVRKSGDEDLDYTAEIYTDDEEEVERMLAAGEFDVINQPVAAIPVEASPPPPPEHEVAETAAPNNDEDEDEEDDSAYLLQLPSRFSHTPISTEQIKRWKQRYHPSRTRCNRYPWSWQIGNHQHDKVIHTVNSRYVGDSEGGSQDERPFQHESDSDDSGGFPSAWY